MTSFAGWTRLSFHILGAAPGIPITGADPAPFGGIVVIGATVVAICVALMVGLILVGLVMRKPHKRCGCGQRMELVETRNVILADVGVDIVRGDTVGNDGQIEQVFRCGSCGAEKVERKTIHTNLTGIGDS